MNCLVNPAAVQQKYLNYFYFSNNPRYTYTVNLAVYGNIFCVFVCNSCCNSTEILVETVYYTLFHRKVDMRIVMLNRLTIEYNRIVCIRYINFPVLLLDYTSGQQSGRLLVNDFPENVKRSYLI